MQKEVWKEIIGYEGQYAVSNLGRVKSLARFVPGRNKGKNPVKERILKQSLNGRGYYEVILCKDGKHHNHKLVHRLIAEAFIPNLENKPEIDHIDGNSKNNSIKNLRWATRKENELNPITRKRISISKSGEKHHNYGKRNEQVWNSKKIASYTMSGEFIKEYPSIQEAKRQTGINASNISANLLGKREHAGNRIWKYVNKATQKGI